MISSDFSNLLMFCDAMGMFLVDLISILTLNSPVQTKKEKYSSLKD